jgi:hypothetical protein
VNERGEICDGAHRESVGRMLRQTDPNFKDLEIGYLVRLGATPADYEGKNNHKSDITPNDKKHQQIAHGNQNYIKLRRFAENYGVREPVAVIFLNGGDAIQMGKKFNFDSFKIKDYDHACSVIEKMIEVDQVVKIMNRSNFIKAFYPFFTCHKFDFKRLLSKLNPNTKSGKRLIGKLLSCTNTVDGCTDALIEVYNDKLKEWKELYNPSAIYKSDLLHRDDPSDDANNVA